jgi:hypothetical protein
LTLRLQVLCSSQSNLELCSLHFTRPFVETGSTIPSEEGARSDLRALQYSGSMHGELNSDRRAHDLFPMEESTH